MGAPLTMEHLLASLTRLLMSLLMKVVHTSVPSVMPSAAPIPIALPTLQAALPSLDASCRTLTQETWLVVLSVASLADLVLMERLAVARWLVCAIGQVHLPTVSA